VKDYFLQRNAFTKREAFLREDDYNDYYPSRPRAFEEAAWTCCVFPPRHRFGGARKKCLDWLHVTSSWPARSIIGGVKAEINKKWFDRDLCKDNYRASCHKETTSRENDPGYAVAGVTTAWPGSLSLFNCSSMIMLFTAILKILYFSPNNFIAKEN
jgi:hypothetical protein